MSIFQKNKIIIFKEQNERASIYFKYINILIENLLGLLDASDLCSYNFAKKILHSSSFIYNNITNYMHDTNAIRMIQLCINLATFTLQFFPFLPTSQYYMYYSTNISGLKKIYQCIFTNPLYGLLFFSTFYIKLLQGTRDEIVFNQIATFLNLPTHADLGTKETIENIINYIPEFITGDELSGYKTVLKSLLLVIAVNVSIKSLDVTFSNLLLESIKQINPKISSMSKMAVYIEDRDKILFDDSEIKEHIQQIKKKSSNIKKFIKSKVNPKHKKDKNKLLEEILELKEQSGNTICLDKCEQKIKTKSGCYCDSPCGTTTFLGGKKWCWVDKDKCKKGKFLEKIGDYTYDTCDNEDISKTKKCFTGTKYTDCITTS